MNRAMFDVLSSGYSVDYVGPINPKANRFQHVRSKLGRSLGLGGNFFFFSDTRLNAIRREVEARLARSPSDLAVFHGFTPWVKISPSIPYVAWSDCTFWQYINIFHDISDFHLGDLERIRALEAAWLSRAAKVILRSSWAANQAISDYGLNPSKVVSVGNYGFLEPPPVDSYAGGQDFLMVTTDFQKKGGFVVVDAFRKVRIQHSSVNLHLIGADPGEKVRNEPGISYLGWVDKNDPNQTATLSRALSSALALVHPTTADTNPMVVIEAGYFGCPAISTRRFAIPELIKDGRSGILLGDPTNADELAAAMVSMIESQDHYLRMRKAAREHMLSHYTRDAFNVRVAEEIRKICPTSRE